MKKRRKNKANLYAIGGDMFPIKEGFGIKNIGSMVNLTTDFLNNVNPQIPNIETVPNLVGANSNDTLMEEWGAWSPIRHINKRDLRADSKSNFLNTATSSVNGITQGVGAGSFLGPLGSAVGGIVGGLSGVVGGLLGGHKKRKAVRKINGQIDRANYLSLANLNNLASSIDTLNDWNVMGNFSAYGGELGDISAFLMPYTGNAIAYDAMFNLYQDGGGIHIKKANKGKFTESANKAGMGVLEYARHILANKDDYSTKQIRRANFARNASHWNTHDLGGLLSFNTFAFGGDFSNGITEFNEGGTHELNPYGGVLQGMGDNGLPNLVELGEVKYDDYIFSDRLFADELSLAQANLPSKYKNKSIADIAKNIQKESQERPNDPISKNGLQDNLSRLMGLLELLRTTEEDNIFAKGGKLTNSQKLWILNNNNLTEQEFNSLSKESKERLINNYEDSLLSIKNSKAALLDNRVPTSSIFPNTLPSTATTSINPRVADRIANDTFNNNSKKELSKKNSIFSTQNLRYAPILGSAIGLANDIFGNGYNPDYTAANTISNLSVRPDAIGNYLTYTPFDRLYYLNLLNANAGATRRAITNNSGGNRAVANASLLAADNNYLNAIGGLGRLAEEYNMNQRNQVEGFNRLTNMFNSESDMRALLANNDYIARGAEIRGNLSNLAKQARLASLNNNFNNFFENLGDIGREAYSRAMVNSNPTLLYDINYGNVGYKKAKGGKLKKRK